MRYRTNTASWMFERRGALSSASVFSWLRHKFSIHQSSEGGLHVRPTPIGGLLCACRSVDALDKFVASRGWTAGADASVTMAKTGASAGIDTQTAQQPVIGFALSNAGLMANLSLDLRRTRGMRRSRHYTQQKTDIHGRIVDAVSISERPATAEGRCLNRSSIACMSPGRVMLYVCSL